MGNKVKIAETIVKPIITWFNMVYHTPKSMDFHLKYNAFILLKGVTNYDLINAFYLLSYE